MVDKSGDETGYPAQQSKSAYVQDHLTDFTEGVNKRGNPRKGAIQELCNVSNFIPANRKGKKSLPSFVAETVLLTLPTFCFSFFFLFYYIM